MTDPTSSDTTAPPIGFFMGPLRIKEPAPTTVRIAFWLLISGALVTVAELVFAAVSVDWNAYGSRGGVLIAPFALGAIGIALRLYVSLAILRGYGPVRLYLSLVAGLMVVVTFTSGFDPIEAVLAASIVASVVLVWLPASSRFFAAATAARKSKPARTQD